MYGLVLYCDAGARPTNPGFVGWGIHGYVYTLEELKYTSHLSDVVITNDGYMLKSNFNEQLQLESLESRSEPLQTVVPVEYVDGYGNINHTTTNNVGELYAVRKALLYAITRTDINRVKILADSKYVILGITEYLGFWKSNNWIKKSGGPISNLEIWKEIDHAITELKNRDIELDITWVKGHDGNHGNEIADRYATAAIIMAMRGLIEDKISTTEATDYWKWTVDIHPFITHKGLLFNTLFESIRPGQYYLCDNIRDVDLLGKKSADGAFAYIELKEPNTAIELVRDYHCNVANGSDNLILMRLPYIFNTNNNRDIYRFGTDSMYQKDHFRLDLYGLNDEPITRELKPAKLAIRAVEALSDLSDRLQNYLDGDPQYIATDITHQIYTLTTTVKKKETVTKFVLNKDITNNVSSINLEVNYQTNKEPSTVTIPVTLGIDLPNRNSLKRLESHRPNITLITWMESYTSIRYATVISTDTDRGIWAGIYSNLVILKDTK